MYLFVYLFINILIYLFIYIYLFIHLFIYIFISFLGPYPTGSVISGLDLAAAVPGVSVFHAGTALDKVDRKKNILTNNLEDLIDD